MTLDARNCFNYVSRCDRLKTQKILFLYSSLSFADIKDYIWYGSRCLIESGRIRGRRTYGRLFVARRVEQAHHILRVVMLRVSRWMTNQRFSLALVKTEVVVLTKKRFPVVLPPQVKVKLWSCRSRR